MTFALWTSNGTQNTGRLSNLYKASRMHQEKETYQTSLRYRASSNVTHISGIRLAACRKDSTPHAMSTTTDEPVLLEC